MAFTGYKALDFSGIDKSINALAQKRTLADLGKTIDGTPEGYAKAGQNLLSLGDIGGATNLFALGEKARERTLERQTLSSWGGEASATATPIPAPGAQSPTTADLGGGGIQPSLIQNESGGRWNAQNDAVGAGGQKGHFGRLQFGQARLQEAQAAGAIPPGTTPQAFMQSPELQQRAEQWHFNDIDTFIKQNGLDRAVGQQIGGVPVTVDGMRAVAHLGGKDGLRKFIASGGQYNPSDDNGTRLSDYFAKHGGGGAQPTQVAAPVMPVQQRPLGAPGQPAPVQVAENEADVQRLEAAQAAQPVQMAQAAPQPGAPVADIPAQGAAPAQGFAVPQGGGVPPSIAQDSKVQLWSQRLAGAPTERLRGIAKQNLDLAVKDAEQRMAEGRGPAAVQEFLWARRNGMTQARSPAEYAQENAARSPMSVGPDQTVIDPRSGRIIFKNDGGDKNQRDVASREKIADERGLQGEDRNFYILNGRLPASGEKVTEGQANAALYADRMKEAEAVLTRPDVAAASANRAQRGFSQVPIVGNNLVSSEFQQADQAKRNFINAALRRESGAVISEPEFANAEKQYFPQPGDKPEVLAQKERNRMTAIQGVSNAAGPVYAKRPQNKQPDMSQARRAPDGNTYIPDPSRPGKYLMVQP